MRVRFSRRLSVWATFRASSLVLVIWFWVRRFTLLCACCFFMLTRRALLTGVMRKSDVEIPSARYLLFSGRC